MHIFATQKFKLSSFFLLQNIAFRVLVLLISLLFIFSSAKADDKIIIFDNFQLEHPEDFEQLRHNAAIVYLRHKTQQYPTFNIIKSSLAWPYETADAEEQMKKMEQEYRSVGIKNVTAKSSIGVKIANIQAYLIELSFFTVSKNFRSKVWVLSQKDRHYVMTAIFEENSEIEQIEAINRIISSIRQTNSEPKQLSLSNNPERLNTERSDKKYSLLLVSVIFIGYFYFRSRRRKSKD